MEQEAREREKEKERNKLLGISTPASSENSKSGTEPYPLYSILLSHGLTDKQSKLVLRNPGAFE